MASKPTASNDWLIFDSERRLIICTLCRTGVAPKYIEGHRDNHLKLTDRVSWKALCSQLPIASAIGPWDDAEVAYAQSFGFSPNLTTEPDGVRCTFRQCGYTAGEESTMVKHVNSHEVYGADVERSIWSERQCRSFSIGPKSRFSPF